MSDPIGPPDDESFDVTLRSAQELAERSTLLGAVLTRIGLESIDPEDEDAESDDTDDVETERLDVIAWLRDAGLLASLSPRESQLMLAPVGTLGADTIAESSWQAERLAALAWAGRLRDDLPPFHQPADVSTVLAVLPAPWDDAAAFTKRVELRSEDEIGFELERCDVWLWRAETETTRHLASKKELPEIALAIAEVVAESVEMGIVERAPDGDFLVDGDSFHRISENTRAMIETIAAERLRALNWLRGAEDDWDELSTEL